MNEHGQLDGENAKYYDAFVNVAASTRGIHIGSQRHADRVARIKERGRGKILSTQGRRIVREILNTEEAEVERQVGDVLEGEILPVGEVKGDTPQAPIKGVTTQEPIVEHRGPVTRGSITITPSPLQPRTAFEPSQPSMTPQGGGVSSPSIVPHVTPPRVGPREELASVRDQGPTSWAFTSQPSMSSRRSRSRRGSAGSRIRQPQFTPEVVNQTDAASRTLQGMNEHVGRLVLALRSSNLPYPVAVRFAREAVRDAKIVGDAYPTDAGNVIIEGVVRMNDVMRLGLTDSQLTSVVEILNGVADRANPGQDSTGSMIPSNPGVQQQSDNPWKQLSSQGQKPTPVNRDAKSITRGSTFVESDLQPSVIRGEGPTSEGSVSKITQVQGLGTEAQERRQTELKGSGLEGKYSHIDADDEPLGNITPDESKYDAPLITPGGDDSSGAVPIRWANHMTRTAQDRPTSIDDLKRLGGDAGRWVSDEVKRRVLDPSTGEPPRNAPGVINDLGSIQRASEQDEKNGQHSQGTGGTGELLSQGAVDRAIAAGLNALSGNGFTGPSGPPLDPRVMSNVIGAGMSALSEVPHSNNEGGSSDSTQGTLSTQAMAQAASSSNKMMKKGSIKIDKERPPPINRFRAVNQVKRVQQGVAAYKGYRDIFRTSYR